MGSFEIWVKGILQVYFIAFVKVALAIRLVRSYSM
jgi:hypothetical protein